MAVDSAKLLAFVGSSLLMGEGVAGSGLWESKARELMRPGALEVNSSLCYSGTSVTSVPLNESLFLQITQVIHTHENMAICSILLIYIPFTVVGLLTSSLLLTCLSCFTNQLTNNLFCTFTPLLKAAYFSDI